MADFVLRSPEVKEGGTLPKEFTGDGDGISPPLEWSGARPARRATRVIMHHIAPDATKWYWVLYNIPADVTSLPKNVKGIGTRATTASIATWATPRRSPKGPGEKKYTLHALCPLGGAEDHRPARGGQPRRAAGGHEGLDPGHGRIERDLHASDRLRSDKQTAAAATADGDDRPASADEDRRRRRRAMTDSDARDREPTSEPDAASTGRRLAQADSPGSRRAHRGAVQERSAGLSGLHALRPQAPHDDLPDGQPGAGRASWKSQYEPGQSVYLLENGHLLHCCFTKNRGFTSGGEGGRLEEFDWDGNIVWEFEYSDRPAPLAPRRQAAAQRQRAGAGRGEEDLRGLPGGGLRSADDCATSSCSPSSSSRSSRPGPRAARSSGSGTSGTTSSRRTIARRPTTATWRKHPELIDVNCNGRATPAFWNHGNSIAYNAQLDQIMLSARGCNEIWVVDHGTTTAGGRRPRRRQARQGRRPALSLGQPGRLPARHAHAIVSCSSSTTPSGFPRAAPARAIS